MTENGNEVLAFPYPDGCTAQLCEEAAERIRDLTYVGLRVALETRIEIGRELLRVERLLPQGQFGPWLEHAFPLWNYESLRRCRVLAQRVDVHYVDSPQVLENLHKFEHITAAEEWITLPEEAQARVVEAGAFTRAAFQAVVWRIDAEDCLANEQMEHGHRYGVVKHDIDEILHDESAPGPLREAARELYEQHRETFARLADREPAEVDVETGVEWREPDGARPSAQLVEADEGLWLCRWDGERFQPVAPVSSHVLMWPGPEVLAAFPKTNGNAGTSAWQRAFRDAGCQRVGASTLAKVYGEVL